MFYWFLNEGVGSGNLTIFQGSVYLVMDTKKFREEYKMSQRGFSVFFKVPYGTVKNWDARNCAPVYFMKLCYRFMELLGGVEDDKTKDT